MLAETTRQLAQDSALLTAVTVLLGLFVGSFLNVVIHRLPPRLRHEWRTECRSLLELDALGAPESEPDGLVKPRSRCPHCGHAITALENIPILSYLFLRGRCAGCGRRISIRYPLVELFTGILSGLVAWQFGFSATTGFVLLLTWGLIALSFIDIDTQLLPDKIVYPLLWLGLLANSQGLLTDIHSALYGAIGGYLALWSVYHLFRLLTGKEGMGYGDFKLLALLGAWLGWQMLPVIILLSSVIGAVVGIAGILALGRDQQLPIPFGPYLAGAGLVALFVGERLVASYLQFAGLG